MVRFVESPLTFNQLNISRADIPCVLGNGARGAAPVTLYITVNITNLYKSLPNIPTEDDDSHTEEATTPGRIQFSTPEHHLPLSHRQPVETSSTVPQSREEVSPTSALHRADEAMKQIVPIDGSNAWERALERIKWVMDTLGPIAEVRVISFDVLG